MAANDSTAPATKLDVQLIIESITGVHVSIAESEERTKRYMEQSEERTKRHFNVVAEQIHHDAVGANRDEIEVIKDRVTRLERHTGLRTV